MGEYAVHLIDQGISGRAIGIKNNKIMDMPIMDALAVPRQDLSAKIKTFEITK